MTSNIFSLKFYSVYTNLKMKCRHTVSSFVRTTYRSNAVCHQSSLNFHLLCQRMLEARMLTFIAWHSMSVFLYTTLNIISTKILDMTHITLNGEINLTQNFFVVHKVLILKNCKFALILQSHATIMKMMTILWIYAVWWKQKNRIKKEP